MTQALVRRIERPDRSISSSGHALELVRSALGIAELLVEHVVEPTAAGPDTHDLTKEVGEVAMLLRLAQRVLDDEGDRARIAAVAGRITALARSGDARNLIVLRPSRAAPHVLAHGCLQQVGCVDEEFHELARAALTATAAGANERVPYRLLDVAWIRHLLLGDEELHHPAAALSPIGQGVDLVGTTIDDAYAFSHALPYATDFGRLPLPAWVDRSHLSGTTDALVLKALDEDDLDLLGELLMAPALLRTPWTSVQWFGWQVLCRTWSEHGFVPGPGLPPAVEGESATQRVHRVLGTVYHTTLVGGLAAATLVATGWLPPDDPPTDAPYDAPVVEPGDRSRAWRRVWSSLAPAERDALAAVPLGMALHRAVSDVDVVAVLAALRGPGAECLPQPLAVQAAELVVRLALLAGRP
jgi:hypothetical protein